MSNFTPGEPNMDVNYRVATCQDHEAIKELSKDIYGGTDLLAHNFIGWLKKDEWFLFVGEVNQPKVIAFTAVHVTDGTESINIRSSRVDKEYRGGGVNKGMFRYAFQYVKDKLLDIKHLYSIKPENIRVPGGYEIIKKIGLMKMFLNVDQNLNDEEIAKSKMQVMTWPEFKVFYDSNDAVKDLFIDAILQIHCDLFSLNCTANWTLLQGRVDTRIMLTEYEGEDGKVELTMSFLRLGKFFTSDGVPMAALNVYGLNKSGLKYHMRKRALETFEHFGGERFLVAVWVEKEMLPECVNIAKEFVGCNVDHWIDMNLLVGDLSKNLEDVQID